MRELAPQDKGAYVRPGYAFNGVEYLPDPGRYTLYLGQPCPWCHRVLMTLRLRGLESALRVVRAADDPERASRGGWVFDAPEPVFGANDLREVYDAAAPGGGGFRGRCTAPFMVDALQKTAVSNDSASLMRALNALEVPGASSDVDLAPPALLDQIDAWNARLGGAVNDGVYRAGFATTQAAHDAAAGALWAALAEAQAQLAETRFLTGDRFTEADARLFATAVRFDAAYLPLFLRGGARRLADFPALAAWLRDCAQLPLPRGGVLLDTVDVDDCRRSYFRQLFPLNPGGLLPLGPTAADLNLLEPAGRGSLAAEDVFHRRRGGAAAA
jgi:putative glutathione S-transferase